MSYILWNITNYMSKSAVYTNKYPFLIAVNKKALPPIKAGGLSSCSFRLIVAPVVRLSEGFLVHALPREPDPSAS